MSERLQFRFDCFALCAVELETAERSGDFQLLAFHLTKRVAELDAEEREDLRRQRDELLSREFQPRHYEIIPVLGLRFKHLGDLESAIERAATEQAKNALRAKGGQ